MSSPLNPARSVCVTYLRLLVGPEMPLRQDRMARDLIVRHWQAYLRHPWSPLSNRGR